MQLLCVSGTKWDWENQQCTHQSEKHPAFGRRLTHRKKILNKHIICIRIIKICKYIETIGERVHIRVSHKNF